MSDPKVIDIRDVLKAATPGPWFYGKPYLDDEGFREIPLHSNVQGADVTPAAVFLQFPNAGSMQEANAALICWLRNNAEKLLADVEYAERMQTAGIYMARLADEAWSLLDADMDMKCLKLLRAMAGQLPGYRADVDEVHAALAKNPELAAGGRGSSPHLGGAAGTTSLAGGQREPAPDRVTGNDIELTVLRGENDAPAS